MPKLRRPARRRTDRRLPAWRGPEALPGAATVGAVLAVLALVLLPHVTRLPLWLTAAIVLAGAWRLHLAQRRGALPPRLLRIAATVAGALGVYAHYGTLIGLDAGVALLALMAGLKLLETARRRDLVIALYLAYFLVVTQFLYSQSAAMAAYMLAVVLVATTVLIGINRATGSPLERRHLRTAASLLAQALPIMLVLFVLFPRLPGPLWQMPDDAYAARTGLDDTMTPGAVSQLSRSDEVAFRVRFDGEPPVHRERYWRGLVLAGYDGRSWQRLNLPGGTPALSVAGEPVSYEITLEPHNRRWLFALDAPTRVPARGSVTPALELLADEPVRELQRYRLRSHTRHQLGERLSAGDRRGYTALPVDVHPQARALAREWRAAAGDDDRAVVQRALAHFREQPFHYTLQPPLLTGDTVDEFLFESRRGFCEHYAGAFTVLMRAAGIPTRVVAGYLGGEMVDGEYMVVRQSDAHAWTEVWLDGAGWTRVDPTGAVAPTRVESGLGAALAGEEDVPAMARQGFGWQRRLGLWLDRLDARWDQWVLGYNANLQQDLMSRFGLGAPTRMALVLALALVTLMATAAALTLLGTRRAPGEPVARAWWRFQRRLARIGLPRVPSEGPQDYVERVAAARPDLADQVRRIGAQYLALRYGPGQAGDRVNALAAAVRRFRPRRRAKTGPATARARRSRGAAPVSPG
ncbi:transglutaminase TgpA family protein [Spiribacter halobius]|nr:DUF3488 and transglutaminase-like domain-containing protein [Spiribacter halobius]UEX79403.1 DUF3488 and transglutaminase-like domain-containing protein [Spiribacter halobius]